MYVLSLCKYNLSRGPVEGGEAASGSLLNRPSEKETCPGCPLGVLVFCLHFGSTVCLQDWVAGQQSCQNSLGFLWKVAQ